ncbi:hypothetical protein [Streptomyces sp. NPDC051567]|uniref:hypothetical protein n=1 Tax=Streptomyces sp. NPDC051567 TaxID=3365660 RepID=UPI0037A4437D
MKRFRIPALVAAAVLTAGTGIAVAQAHDPGTAPGGAGAAGGAVAKAPFQRVLGDLVSVPPGQIGNATAYCPAGTVSSGGGNANVALVGGGELGRAFVVASLGSGTTWQVAVRNTNTVAEGIRAFVVCTTP